jgi:hypothetical protein
MSYYLFINKKTTRQTESEEMKMKEEFGFYIRKTVVKNLLSAHRKIADRGNVKSLIILTKFILKISNQFNDMLIDLELEENATALINRRTHSGAVMQPKPVPSPEDAEDRI